jgi:hypothetical protein
MDEVVVAMGELAKRARTVGNGRGGDEEKGKMG